MIYEDIENTIWKINIDDSFHVSIKEELLSLATNFNITFSDKESLKFKSSQIEAIQKLVEELLSKNKLESSVIELVMVD